MPGFRYPSSAACGFGSHQRRMPYDERRQRQSSQPAIVVNAKIEALKPPVSGDLANIPKPPGCIQYDDHFEAAKAELGVTTSDEYYFEMLKGGGASTFKVRQTKLIYFLKSHPAGKIIWLLDESAFFIWPKKSVPVTQ